MGEKIKVVSPEGWTWEGITFEQSLLLHDRFTSRPQSTAAQSPTPSPTKASATTTASDGTFELLAEVVVEPKYALEHRLIAIVAGHAKEGVTVATLMRALKIDTPGGIGARLGGVGRICKRARIDKTQILVKHGSGKTATYHPGPMLLQRIDDLPPVPTT